MCKFYPSSGAAGSRIRQWITQVAAEVVTKAVIIKHKATRHLQSGVGGNGQNGTTTPSYGIGKVHQAMAGEAVKTAPHQAMPPPRKRPLLQACQKRSRWLQKRCKNGQTTKSQKGKCRSGRRNTGIVGSLYNGLVFLGLRKAVVYTVVVFLASSFLLPDVRAIWSLTIFTTSGWDRKVSDIAQLTQGLDPGLQLQFLYRRVSQPGGQLFAAVITMCYF